VGRVVTQAISSPQRAALATLAAVVDPATYLAGGVAVALRLQHRSSRDLALFVAASDPVMLIGTLEERGVRVLSRAGGTLHLDVGGVPVSILRYRYPLLGDPESVVDVPIPVASLDDLESMKLSAIAGRGAARDFWDLHALLTARGRPLAAALDAYKRKFAAEDVGHLVRSLIYFDDAEAEPMPAGLTDTLWGQMKGDLRAWVGAL
jgi:Nucleotidyl transferase AbiEii toxin, Type IV TA system